MKAIVNEPQAEYKTIGWLPQIAPSSFDENIRSIENRTILYYPPNVVSQQLFEKQKKKLSLLRGKMTKQSEKEIDDQILFFRNEWGNIIDIPGIIDSVYCVSTEDGEKVYELIKKAITEKRKIEISFLNAELVTASFLMPAIGELYKDFSDEEIAQYLSVKDLPESSDISLKNVIQAMKYYLKDPEGYQKIIDDNLDE